MHILKRTNGIDMRATKTHIQGLAEIVLKDPDTGKIKETVKQKNFFTVALDSLVNKVPFALNDASVYQAAIGNESKYINQLIGYPSIIDKALGGVILFPDSLGDDVNLLYPSFDTNYPTGYAGKESYTLDDSRQGTYDSISSGPITNGYRHVFAWGSSYGNGTIGAVALSNSKCYKYFRDYATMLGSGSNNSYYIYGNGVIPDTRELAYYTIIGVNKRGVYLRTSSNKIYFTPLPMNRIDLLVNYGNPFATRHEIDYTIPANSYVCLDEDDLHVFTITSASESSTSITHTIIDLDDETSTSTSFTVNAYITGGNQLNSVCAIRGDYLYMAKNGNTSSGGSIYKINLTNVADVTELTSTSNMQYSYNFWNVGGLIMGSMFIIGDDDVIREVESNCTWMPIYRKGVWVVKAVLPVSQWASNGFTGINVDVLQPYCATHANLETPVTKTSNLQMVVNYSVLQV